QILAGCLKCLPTYWLQPDQAGQLGQAAANTLVKAFEAAGKDLTAESFKTAMEGLSFNDPILDVNIAYGADDHQGGGTIVVSQIKDGKWVEIGRAEPTE